MPREAAPHESRQQRLDTRERIADTPAVRRCFVAVFDALQPRRRARARPGVLDALGVAAGAREEVRRDRVAVVGDDLAGGRRDRCVRARRFRRAAEVHLRARVRSRRQSATRRRRSSARRSGSRSPGPRGAAIGQLGRHLRRRPRRAHTVSIGSVSTRDPTSTLISPPARRPERGAAVVVRKDLAVAPAVRRVPAAPHWLIPMPWPQPAPAITRLVAAAAPRSRGGERAGPLPRPSDR